MRIIRFMSRNELSKLMSGQRLRNKTDHHAEYGGHTNSKGFCFFDTSVPPEARMKYLTGVVCMEAVVELETDMQLQEGYGMYRDPEKELPDLFSLLFTPVPMKKLKEYSISEYSLHTVRIIRIGLPKLWPHRIEWKEGNDIDNIAM